MVVFFAKIICKNTNFRYDELKFKRKKQMKEINIKKFRLVSNIGLFLLVVGLILTWLTLDNMLTAIFGMTIAIFGWFVFSKYHTQIAIYELHKITNEYVDDVKKNN